MASAPLPFLDEFLPISVRPQRPRPDALAATALLGADFDRAFHTAIEEEGVLGEALRHHFRFSGGLSRARLGLDAGDALELDRAVSVPFAVACELLHNASLVHDDIQAREGVRRGQSSVWAHFGEDIAARVGDFLLTKAFEVAATAPVDPSRALDVLQAFTRATTAVVESQMAENEIIDRGAFDLRRYREIAQDKAGPLIALPVQAALAATGDAGRHVDEVNAAFEILGVVDQIQIDIADLIGREGRGAGRALEAGRPNLVIALHEELVDDQIGNRLAAARTLALSRPDHLESLALELSHSPALDHAFFFADQIVEHARTRARALPHALHETFERCATRLVAPLDQLRALHGRARQTLAVAVEARSHCEDITVEARA
jgi:geranylgeranyl pyrophosphate synthase